MSAFTDKKLLLDAASTTQDLTQFTTTNAACSKILVYTATAPTAANKAAAGVDIITFPTTGGTTLTWAKIDKTKTALVGTHEFTISAADWWGNTNAKTLKAKVLISDADCEDKSKIALTFTGAADATYKMGDADVEYAYAVAAKTPAYCKFTIAAQAVPAGLDTHVKNDATNKKFKLTKFEGAGSLAKDYSLKVDVTTFHGTKLVDAAQIWTKKITVTDPCTLANLKYTTTTPTANLEYQIGAADFTIMDAASQIAQPGGDATKFCLKRVKAAFTFTGDTSPTSLFKTDHGTTGKLIFLQNYSVADKKEITVAVQYKLDGTTDLTGIKYSFKVTTKAVCGSPTFTLPSAQSSTPSLYVGRTQTLTWPAWTPNPSFCKFTYVVDTTNSGGFGASNAKFTVKVDSATRTIGIDKATTFTSGEKKTYTIPITAKYPDNAGTLAAGKSYSYKFTLADDPCTAGTPTQKFKTAKETKTWKVTVLSGKDVTFDVPVSWTPSACDGTHTYDITYGTGQVGDKTLALTTAADKYLSYSSSTKQLKINKYTGTAQVGTGYVIYATAKTSAGVAITGADNKLTINLEIVDPCLTATSTFAPISDVVYTLGANAVTFNVAKATISAPCVNEIAWPAEYTITVPSKLSSVVTKGSVSGDKLPYTIAKTSDTKLVGTHVMTVEAKQGSTALKTKLSFNIVIKEACDSATLTKVTPKDTNW